MRIHVYSFTWHEALLVPYFLRHYSPAWVEKITVFDNLSDDGTPALLGQDPRVEVRSFDTGGTFNESALTALRDSCWKESRGKADWVAVVDFDEFLWAPAGVPAFLAGLPDDVAVLRGQGRQMVATEFPVDDGRTPLTDLVRTGVYPAPLYDKPCLFSPDRVGELRSEQGLHDAHPVDLEGKPLEIAPGPLLLHYRLLGPAYHAAKNRAQMTRPHMAVPPARFIAGMLR
jgi:hypothetical protein